MEVDFNIHLHSHWNSILAAGVNLPLPNCFDGLFIQPHTQGLLNANVMRPAIQEPRARLM